MLCAILTGTGPIALGQEPVKEPNWPVVRKADLAAIDRGIVERWLEAQIQQLLTGEDIAQGQADASAFHKKLVEQKAASDAAQAFKDRLADMLAAGFAKQYKAGEESAKPPRPIGASAILMVLRDYARPSALPCFQTALKDPTPGPRFVAAEGLLKLSQGFNDQEWTALLPDVQKTATSEWSDPALDRLYRVLFAAGANAARTDAVAAALMAILDARSTDYEKTGKMPPPADGEALAWLAQRAERANNAALRTAAITRAAHLLANATHYYANEKPGRARQEELELVIRNVEPQLEKLVKAADRNAKTPNPTVWNALATNASDRETKMTEALAQWIGSGQTQGVLNQQPFGLPVGLGIKWKTPSTATAPAE